MAQLDRRAIARLAGTACAVIVLQAVASLIVVQGSSASTDLAQQPPCGFDPVILIDPCESLPASGPAADPAQQIPWDVIDSVLFG